MERGRYDKTKINILHLIARNLPKSLIYWCGIVIWAHATGGEYGNTEAPAVTMDEALRRWDWK
jgi:hypothetical protein